MTRRPKLDAWLAESAAVLEEVFPTEHSDPSVELHGLAWLPTYGMHRHRVAPTTTPLVVEGPAGDGASAGASPATNIPGAALKRIAMAKAKKTAQRFGNEL